jgi:diguanylate cyclase (GGDEF)-like protein/PAS domain S-box-containing protein
MVSMREKTSEKSTTNLTEDALSHSRNILLAHGRATRSIQRAHTAEEVYRAVGDQIKSLGGEVTLFMVTDDRQSLTVVHTSYESNLIRNVEKIMRTSVIGYHFALTPDSPYARDIATGKATYVQLTKEYVVATLPKALHLFIDQFMSILKIEQGIVAPLRVGNEILGLMIVNGLSLKEDDVPAMESFAGQIAISLSNVRLTQQMQNELSGRKLADKELKKSEERYRTLVDGMMDGIYRSTHAGKFVDVNPAMVKMFGYSSREEMLAADIKKDLYFAPEERGSHVLDTGQEEIEIYRMKCKDGSEIWVEDHGHYVHDEQGNILYHEGMLRDITARKQAEKELRERESQLRVLFEQMAVGVARIQTNTGRFIQVNQKDCDIVGYSFEEMKSLNFQSITHPDDLQLDLDNMERLKSGAIREYTMEKRLIHKNGSFVWVELTVSPMWAAGATPDFHIAIVQDITARKQAEENALLQIAALEAAANAIAITDKRGNIQWVNPAWVRLTGYSKEESIGQNTRMLKSTKQDPLFYKNMWETILAGKVWRGELVNRRKDGNLYYEEETITPVLDKQGDVKNFIAIKQDITKRKQAEADLQHAKAELEMANLELKAAFEHEQQLARTDALTGVNNRRYLFELAEHEFDVARRYQQPLAVIMFDIDHFKQINDTYGHTAGDQMLELVTKVACAQLREVDLIGRYGGEEFLIVLPITSAPQAYLLAERIRTSVVAAQSDKGTTIVTLSLGIAEISHAPQDQSVEDVIRRADESMYAAKQAGRNRAMIFNTDTTGAIG